MKGLIIIGAGGVGKETAMLVEDINRSNNEWQLLGYVDDNESLLDKYINGYKVLGKVEWLNSLVEDVYVVCTVSDPVIKRSIISRLNNPNLRYATLIHPTAVISSHVDFGEDIIIQAFCVVTTNVSIGDHVQLNPKCGIGHDSMIGDYSSLYWNVNISGNINVGEGCTLGSNSIAIQRTSIGEWTIIGSGSNIIDDIPAYCTAVGNPAKPIKFQREML